MIPATAERAILLCTRVRRTDLADPPPAFELQRPPTFEYSYGYGRHELLAAFTNTCFLLFVSDRANAARSRQCRQCRPKLRRLSIPTLTD